MPTSERWPVLGKFLLKRRNGKWMSYDERVLGLILTSPHGCRRDNLANAAGLLPGELNVIVDRLVASGRIERNMRSTDDETLFTSPHDDCFWGIAA